eukprot:1802114-Rhodomonas_salina.2
MSETEIESLSLSVVGGVGVSVSVGDFRCGFVQRLRKSRAPPSSEGGRAWRVSVHHVKRMRQKSCTCFDSVSLRSLYAVMAARSRTYSASSSSSSRGSPSAASLPLQHINFKPNAISQRKLY